MNGFEKCKQNFCRWGVAGVLPYLLWRTTINQESKEKIEEIKDLVGVPEIRK